MVRPHANNSTGAEELDGGDQSGEAGQFLAFAGAHQHGYKAENGFAHANIKDTHTFSNGGETWIEVGTTNFDL